MVSRSRSACRTKKELIFIHEKCSFTRAPGGNRPEVFFPRNTAIFLAKFALYRCLSLLLSFSLSLILIIPLKLYVLAEMRREKEINGKSEF